MTTTRMLTPGQAAATLGVDAKTISRWASTGKLASIRTPGGHRRIPADALNALMADGAELHAVGQRVAEALRGADLRDLAATLRDHSEVVRFADDIGVADRLHDLADALDPAGSGQDDGQDDGEDDGQGNNDDE